MTKPKYLETNQFDRKTNNVEAILAVFEISI